MSNIAEQIKILIEVQEVEMSILTANRQVRVHHDEATALDRQLAERKDNVNNARQALDESKKAYRVLESESRDNSQLIEKSNEKLRSVKTNKEYQSMLKEIEEMQKRNSALEDRMIEELDRIELAEKELAEIEAHLATFVKSCEEKKVELAEKAASDQEVVDRLCEKRQKIGATADPKVLATLEEVKKKTRGQAVVAVSGAVCSGCNMNIPAQLYNELQRFDELRFCPHCHRIVYWKGSDPK